MSPIFQISDALARALEKQDQFTKGVETLTAKLSGGDAVTSAKQWAAAIEAIGGASKLTAEENKQFTDTITLAVEKMRLMGEVVPQYWRVIAASVEGSRAAAETGKVLGDQLKELKPFIGTPLLQNTADPNRLLGAVPGAGVTTQQKPDSAIIGALIQGQTWGAQFSAGLNNGLAAIGPTLISALEGGGNIAKSIAATMGQSLSKQMFGTDAFKNSITKHFGDSLGGMFNAILPGIGALAGPLIGKLGSLFGKLFGNDEESKLVNPARDQFAAQFKAQFGGSNSDAVTKALEAAGLGGARASALITALNAADTMQTFNAAKTAIEDALAGTKTGVDQATQATDTFNMSLSGSDEAIKELGTTQLTVTNMMLQGFDRIIAKIGEMIDRLTQAGAAAAAVTPTFSTPGEFLGSAPDQAAPDIPTFHSGGMVWRRAHRGLNLASNEVPIIAQVGERVLNKAETQAYNSGGGMSLTFSAGSIIVNGNNPAEIAAKLVPEIVKQIGRYNVAGSRRKMQVIAGTA